MVHESIDFQFFSINRNIIRYINIVDYDKNTEVMDNYPNAKKSTLRTFYDINAIEKSISPYSRFGIMQEYLS